VVVSTPAGGGGRTGLAWLVCAVLLFSTIEVVSKAIQPARPPLQLAFWRFFLAGLAFSPGAAMAMHRRARRPTAADWGAYGGLGLIGVTLGIGLYHAALARMPAAPAAILFSGHPVIVAVLAPALIGERADRRHWLALALASAGMVCFSWDHGRLSLRTAGGVVLMLASMTAFAIYSTLSKKVVDRHGVRVLSAATFLAGSLALLPVTWTADGPPWRVHTPHHWLAILYLALLATATGYAAWFHGLKQVPAVRAATVFFLKPVAAAALARLLLGERLTPATVAGGLMIVAGTAVALRRGPVEPP